MENNLVLFENKALTVTKTLSDLKKEQDRLAKLEADAKTKLQEAMNEYGVTQFKNDYITISTVEGSTTTSIDLKALEKNEPELYADLLKDYPKVTTKKASVRFTVK